MRPFAFIAHNAYQRLRESLDRSEWADRPPVIQTACFVAEEKKAVDTDTTGRSFTYKTVKHYRFAVAAPIGANTDTYEMREMHAYGVFGRLKIGPLTFLDEKTGMDKRGPVDHPVLETALAATAMRVWEAQRNKQTTEAPRHGVVRPAARTSFHHSRWSYKPAL